VGPVASLTGSVLIAASRYYRVRAACGVNPRRDQVFQGFFVGLRLVKRRSHAHLHIAWRGPVEFG